MPKVIIDTDVLIWYFRGNQNARDFLSNLRYSERCVSSLCLMELIQGCRDKKELKNIKEFIKENITDIIHPDEKVSEKAISLLEKHSLPDGLRTVDALIAASALVTGSSLATLNDKHFRNILNLKITKVLKL